MTPVHVEAGKNINFVVEAKKSFRYTFLTENVFESISQSNKLNDVGLIK